MAQAQAAQDNLAPKALDYQGTPKVAPGTLTAPLDTQLVVLVFQLYSKYHLFLLVLIESIANSILAIILVNTLAHDTLFNKIQVKDTIDTSVPP